MTTVTFSINREEYFTIFVKRTVVGPLFKLFISIFILVFAASLSSVVDLNAFNDWMIIIPAAAIVAAEFALPITLVSLVTISCWLWFRLGPESPMLDAKVKFSFSPDIIKLETTDTNLEFKWRFVRIAKVLKNDYFMQVKEPMGQILFVPKSAFSDTQKEEFEKLLERNV